MNDQEQISGVCYSTPIKLKFRDKLRIKLFPSRYCELPEAPSTYKDVLTCRITSELSMLDRVRVLLTGRIQIECKTCTENLIGEHKTKSEFMALPPKWLDNNL